MKWFYMKPDPIQSNPNPTQHLLQLTRNNPYPQLNSFQWYMRWFYVKPDLTLTPYPTQLPTSPIHTLTPPNPNPTQPISGIADMPFPHPLYPCTTHQTPSATP